MDFNYLKWENLVNSTCPCLFRSHDGDPISFYFHLDNREVKKKLEDLVLKSGGHVVDDYVNMSPVTALLVDDKSVKNFHKRVSFKVSYIVDCVSSGCLMDINNYIHCTTSNSVNDFMDVIFLRKSTFDEENNEGLVEVNLDSNCTCHDRVHSYSTLKHKFAGSRSKPCRINVCQNEDDMNGKNVASGSRSERILQLEETVVPGDENEDKDSRRKCMVETVEKKCLNPCAHCVIHLERNRSADSACEFYSSKNVNSSRTQCKAENQVTFNKKHCLTCKCGSARIGNVQTGRRRDRMKQSNRRRYDSDSSTESNTSKDLSPESSSSNSDKVNQVRRNIRKKKPIISDDDDTDHDNDVSCSRPFKTSNRHIRSLSEEEDDIGPPVDWISKQKIADKHTRKPYTRSEQEAILKYVVRKKAYNTLRGVAIWKKMERSNICPQRTWMSMQNHFRRCLMNELETFPFLTSDQIKDIKG